MLLEQLKEEFIDMEKDKMIVKYENKFEDYKDDITSKFSNFVDNILDAELVIPEKVLEFAKKGELYDDLIEQFKVRLGVDEGLVDDEVNKGRDQLKDKIEDNKFQKHFETIGIRLSNYFK